MVLIDKGNKMKTKRIDHQDFACVAEAVSHYFNQGFTTTDTAENSRIMRKLSSDFGYEEVMITHHGLLNVSASHVEVTA